MNETYIKNVVEAALLAAGRPLQLTELTQLFDESARPDVSGVRAALDTLEADYNGRGIEVKETATGFRIQVRREMANEVSRLWPERPPRYGRALLETLALIAYRQPITRAEIEAVRGVAVNPNIIKTVLERNWVRVVGTRDVPGRPELLGTTKEFLDYFGLRSLEDLPPLAELKAMGEINLQLDLAKPNEPSDGGAEGSGGADGASGSGEGQGSTGAAAAAAAAAVGVAAVAGIVAASDAAAGSDDATAAASEVTAEAGDAIAASGDAPVEADDAVAASGDETAEADDVTAASGDVTVEASDAIAASADATVEAADAIAASGEVSVEAADAMAVSGDVTADADYAAAPADEVVSAQLVAANDFEESDSGDVTVEVETLGLVEARIEAFIESEDTPPREDAAIETGQFELSELGMSDVRAGIIEAQFEPEDIEVVASDDEESDDPADDSSDESADDEDEEELSAGPNSSTELVAAPRDRDD